MELGELPLSVRAMNVLEKAGIATVEELVIYDWWLFVKQRGCGRLTIAEIATVMVRAIREAGLEQVRVDARLAAAERKALKYDALRALLARHLREL